MRPALFLTILLFFIFNVHASPQFKNDTNKVKRLLIKSSDTDTSFKKSPLQLHPEKFKQIDSLDEGLVDLSTIMKFGNIDTADLKMKQCSFEKDANAMVLFDRGELICGGDQIILIRQKRLKIFNEEGKSQANVKIEFDNKYGTEQVSAVEAETLNFENGQITRSKLDPKLIYAVHQDKQRDAIILSLPNVKPGSVIEYRYVWERGFSRNFPQWNFQCDLPTRYSQINLVMAPQLTFSALYRKNQPFVKDTTSTHGFGHLWALASVPAKKDEPYMRSEVDGLQSIALILSSVNFSGIKTTLAESWAEIAAQFEKYKWFNKPFAQSITDDGEWIKKAKALKSNDEKIAYIFNNVKNTMKWNEEKNFVSTAGIKTAWKKKSGNWGEINMILNHFLTEAGIKAYPMLVSTRDNGMLIPSFANIYQINKLVVYIPVDSTKYYVLDATSRYNYYNEIPYDLLNAYGLVLQLEKENYKLVLMKNDNLVKQMLLIDAAISAAGTMEGDAAISSYSYTKANTVEQYKTADEKKYLESLKDGDNNLKISNFKLENADIDSLPLMQNLHFKLELPGTDEKYIYFNPNLLTSIRQNPFVADHRESDVDFGCLKTLNINGRYKIPEGFTIESIPKSVNLLMQDKSISFKRIIQEDEGYVTLHYVITHSKTIYLKEEYGGLHDYYKQLFELLNEPIVLKKN